MKPQRFFIDRDNSGHWYLVDAEFRAAWDSWAGLDEEDEASWGAPDFAERINSPGEFTFERPVDDGNETLAELAGAAEAITLARNLRRKVEAICNDRRGIHWDESGASTVKELRRQVEEQFLAVIDGRANEFENPYEKV